MDQEHEPFLPAKENRQDKCDDSISPTKSSAFLPRCKAWRSGALVHTLLISFYTIMSIAVIRASQDSTLLRPARKQALQPLIPHLKTTTCIDCVRIKPLIPQIQRQSTISISNTPAQSSTICPAVPTPAFHPQPSTQHGTLSSHRCIFAFPKPSFGAIIRSLWH